MDSIEIEIRENYKAMGTRPGVLCWGIGPDGKILTEESEWGKWYTACSQYGVAMFDPVDSKGKAERLAIDFYRSRMNLVRQDGTDKNDSEMISEIVENFTRQDQC